MGLIKDALTGFAARVFNFRLETSSVATDENFFATIAGDSYNINTGLITLTSANASAILYFKNNEVQSFHVRAIAVGVGVSANGTGQTVIEIIKKPSTGTIVDDTVNVDINSNRNYGTDQTLSASLVYKGAEGKTFTDGSQHILIFGGFPRAFAAIDEILKKGDAIGVRITPPAGNTSQVVYAAIISHLEEIKA